MNTALLLDYKSQNLKRIVETVLEPLVIPLKGFDKLQIRLYPDTYAKLEDRQKKEHDFKCSIEEWSMNQGLKYDVDISCDVEGIAQGPCHIWYKNIVVAFQDNKIDRIVYLPFDITFMVPKADIGKNVKKLQHFIDRANEGEVDLLLGSYESSTDVTLAADNNFLIDNVAAGEGNRKDIPKNFLEDFTILELQRNFPGCMAWFRKQRTDPSHQPKPRTGFFSLSRGLYDQFKEDRGIMKPWAGTVQLLICAAIRTREGKDRFTVAEQFVADLEESPASWDGYGAAHQRLRIEFVIADEREYWSRKLPQVTL